MRSCSFISWRRERKGGLILQNHTSIMLLTSLKPRLPLSPCQRKSRQHLQDVSISQLFSHGAVHLPPWHSLDKVPISQTPGITGLWEILLDCIVCIFHFPQQLLLRFFRRSVKPSQQWLIVMEQSHPSVSTAWHKQDEGYLGEALLLFLTDTLTNKKPCSSTAYKELIK